MTIILRLFLTLLTLSACSCAQTRYARTPAGNFSGKLIVEWVGHDAFVFRPDAQRPFTFTRHNGQVIQPGTMFTDGGSIPRPLWSIRAYSPWGFGPGYMIHDWLFTAHHLQIPPDPDYNFQDSANVLAECIKTLMEDVDTSKNIRRDPFALYSIYLAVSSPVAKHWWDKHPSVLPAPGVPERVKVTTLKRKVIAREILDFGS